MKRETAEALTEQIRQNVADLAKLMKQAWEGKVWEPLDYGSFSAWLAGEFRWSHARGYQLIAIATMDEELRARVPLPPDWAVSDRQTRQIISLGTEAVLATFAAQAGDDAHANAALLPRLLKELASDGDAGDEEETPRVSSTVVELPQKVSGGIRDARTGMSITHSFATQSRSLPKPRGLRPEVVQQLRDTVGEAVSLAENRLAEYEAELLRLDAEAATPAVEGRQSA